MLKAYASGGLIQTRLWLRTLQWLSFKGCKGMFEKGGKARFDHDMLVYLVIYDSGQVSLEQHLLSRHPSHGM